MSWFEVHVDSADVGAEYAVVRLDARAGDRAPLHRHTRESETLVVLSGQLLVTVGDDRSLLGPDECAVGPLGVPLSYEVVGDAPARSLVVVVPGGFEEAFRAMDRGDGAALAAAGVELVE